MILSHDTVFAVASGPGRGGVAVIRISGPAAGSALLASARLSRMPTPRHATRVTLRQPGSDDVVDRGLALWFPGPASFTGEDVVELQVHGGRAVVGACLALLSGLPGMRPAEPGEFTRRAFENGKLDLTAAEGLADLVAADTDAQRRQALRQLDGALGRLYDDWRDTLLRALAHAEAEIDFPDEDLPGGLEDALRPGVAALLARMLEHLDDGGRGERLREGVSVVILGPPNAGKSSLLNALAGRDAAIVSTTAGTTRDVIEVSLDLGGLPVVLADTAGLREAAEAVESEGVRRALQRAAHADLKVVVAEAASWPALPAAVAELLDGDAMLVLNKIDLQRPAGAAGPSLPARPHAISVASGEGMAEFLTALQQAVAARAAPAGVPSVTRLRHRRALQDCVAALQRFVDGAAGELGAEDLRIAARALGRITGRVDVEDMLDLVFREFCIGK